MSLFDWVVAFIFLAVALLYLASSIIPGATPASLIDQLPF